MLKWMKRLTVVAVVLGVLGTVGVTTGMTSYLRTSSKAIKSAVKDSIPIEFEIQRARDLLDDLVPELKANTKLVASEEVEVASLEQEIARQQESIAAEREKVQLLRASLREQKANYRFGAIDYEREELVGELARRFDHLKMAEKLVSGKKDLLKNRQRSLEAAIRKLEQTHVTRVQLAAEIEDLEAQFRLLDAQAGEGEFKFDDSKLAETQKVIRELRKKLDVSQRYLAREAKFLETIPIEAPEASEDDVVDRVDAYLRAGVEATSVVDGDLR